MKIWHVVVLILLIAGGYGLYRVISKPIPGQKMADMGQDHVSPQRVLETKYNSNPATSGPHLPTWVKPGILGAPQSEGELIHSLEHGYIIISYNCGVHLIGDSKKLDSKTGRNFLSSYGFFILPSVIFAHEEEGSPSASFQDPYVATGSAINESDGCKTLVKNLTELANKKKLWKLVVVPRPQLDTTIALTAWTYVDTFDTFDAKRIEKFIDYHRDHGPEKTME